MSNLRAITLAFAAGKIEVTPINRGNDNADANDPLAPTCAMTLQLVV